MEIKNLDTAPKAGVAETPQPAAPAPTAPATLTITAKDGRKFVLKKLKPSARCILAEALGMKSQSGEIQSLVAATVFSIDEDVYTPLTDRDDLFARLDEIGDIGLAAVTDPALLLYAVGLSEKDAKALKNS